MIVFFVVSTMDRRTRKVRFDLGDSGVKLRRGQRQVFGTGTADRNTAMARLVLCREGRWSSAAREERRERQAVDKADRKARHTSWKRKKRVRPVVDQVALASRNLLLLSGA